VQSGSALEELDAALEELEAAEVTLAEEISAIPRTIKQIFFITPAPI